MKDKLNNELKVGDYVVWSASNGVGLNIGKITNIMSKMIKIDEWQNRYPSDVAKIGWNSFLLGEKLKEI